MRKEFFVEYYLANGSGDRIKIAELACASTDTDRSNLAQTLTKMYRDEDDGRVFLNVRAASAEDAVDVRARLSGPLAAVWEHAVGLRRS
jgi:hypothetical protein